MICVRPASQTDAAALAALEIECFSQPWSEKALSEELSAPHARFFAACDDAGRIIGYAGMLFAADQAEITNVAVTEGCRRQGVGKALMQALEDEARAGGMTVMQLEVRESGTAARALYAQMGYREVGIRKRFYRLPTEDAVLMNKELAQARFIY